MPKIVAFLIGSLSGGGAERVISNLSLHINERIERYIILYSCEEQVYPYKGELIKLKPCNKGGIQLRKVYNLLRYAIATRNIKTDHGIQVCVSFLPAPNLLNILSRSQEKVILSVRTHTSIDANNFYKKLLSFTLRLLYTKGDLIVAVSQGVKRDLVNNFGLEEKKIKVIYNPYDITSIRQSMYEQLDENYKSIFLNPVIINVGSLTYPKGQSHLIRAFCKVKKSHNKAKLVFLGRGELEGELRRIVSELNLENDVHFLGFQANPFQFIGKSTIYVLPSLYEGFPNALVEAMACGVPVISADCRSGPREILAPDSDVETETAIIEYTPYGILVPVCDGKNRASKSPLTCEENIMAESIIELLDNHALREKYSSMAQIRANDFELQTIISQWENIIDSLILSPFKPIR